MLSETPTYDEVFAELRSACNTHDMEKAHNCVRWFLLHSEDEPLVRALRYAIDTVRQETRDSYRWPWWFDFIERGKRASIERNDKEHFRILAPDMDILRR